jgi:hypothetical protein
MRDAKIRGIPSWEANRFGSNPPSHAKPGIYIGAEFAQERAHAFL